MYRKFSKYFRLLLSLLISRYHKGESQLRTLSANTVQYVEGICPSYQPATTPTFSATAFENCRESAQFGILSTHPDQDKTTPEILTKYGYPYETHKVSTKDNYILTVYRIIGSPNISPEKWAKKKYPVYLAHGALMASDGWNFQPGNRNLPFKLADAGFEVWLANSRGTSYSREHETYNADRDLQYWDYGYHELGVYDVPAISKKILSVSGAEKILYIGHSMGASQLFIGLSSIPELNQKVEAAFLMAPVAFMGRSNFIMKRLSPFLSSYLALQVLNPVLRGRFGTPHNLLQTFNISLGSLCTPTAMRCGLCESWIFQTQGFNAPQINSTEIPNIMAKSANTVSAKLFSHAMQLMRSCNFQQYDYGLQINLDRYGSPLPPDYKLGNIRAPMYLYYGESDKSVTPLDVAVTASHLAPGVLMDLHKVEDELWNHNDFIFAKDADKMVYNRIVGEMERRSRI